MNVNCTEIRPIWTPRERAAWRPPEDITVSEWAERHRRLPKQSAIPGPWNNRLVPYTVGVMDSFLDPVVERITIMASVQSAKTESAYNMLGYAISQDPAPVLVVMPTDKTLRRVNRRLQDMITESPELAQYLTGDPDDMQKRSIVLKRMDINFATAGSKADLANVEARYLLMDEPDRYPSATGDEGSPQEMAEARLTTYWNRKIIEPCTPTIPEGHINVAYESSDKRKYWVPCPECGGYQVLSFWQIKHQGEKRGEWPQDKRNPDYIKQDRVARYECLYCQAEIDDKDKPGMLARGKWVPEGHPIARDGVMAPPPPVSHVGFWWNVLYSPFRNFSEIAAQFFSTKDHPEQYKTFVNLWLAEPWKEIVKQRESSVILQLRTHRPSLVVPEEALALTAGIDSQRRGFWVVIRAWVLTAGGLRESHKIRHGFVESFGELEQWVFEDVYRTDISGIEYLVWRGLIDTGGGLMGEGEATLTEQVYNWLRRSGRGRIFGSKGSSKPLSSGRLAIPGHIDRYPSGKPLPGGLVLWRLDTNSLKDFIWARIENGLFHLDGGADEIPEADKVYAAHLSAEIKERTKRNQLIWTTQRGRDNHLLDCEVMAAGAAEAFNVWLLPRPQAQNISPGMQDGDVNRLTGLPKGQFWK